MNSIKNEIINEIEINKSRFINVLIPVTNTDEVLFHLSSLRKKYPDASHHCYAYVIGNNCEIQKYSDDGEPSKTAGMPMLEVLKKQGLTNVLNVSIRYFGGIKLGAGGLVRAYTKSCSESCKLAELTTLKIINELEVIVSFNDIGRVEKFIRDHYDLKDTTYDQLVHYFITIEKDQVDRFINEILEHTFGSGSVKIIKEYEEYK